MSELDLYCSACGERSRVAGQARGSTVPCPFCEAPIAVPALRQAAARTPARRLARNEPGAFGLVLACLVVAALAVWVWAMPAPAWTAGALAAAGCLCAVLAIAQERVLGGLVTMVLFVAMTGYALHTEAAWQQAERVQAGTPDGAARVRLPRLRPGGSVACDGCRVTFMTAERTNGALVVTLELLNRHWRMPVLVQEFWRQTALQMPAGEPRGGEDAPSTGVAAETLAPGARTQVTGYFTGAPAGPCAVLCDPGLYRAVDGQCQELSGRQIWLLAE